MASSKRPSESTATTSTAVSLEGPGEVMPLYLAAARDARDFAQPLFCFGSPRLVRLGEELTF